ncbi:hypothetical protein P43SY_008477 [Pythium insidiosum]|uniref:Diphthine--ammonia ligase n=1 Tax=Pythium insidiosum TaxID=114742 RepID=A0AAD5LQE9_PYTIN|nr:hypothetical protein P43SY_008477 [Pythium insidiosum]
MARPRRVVSLLPSATENFSELVAFARRRRPPPIPSAALPELVGRSHECDFPTTSDVQGLPVLTAPRTAFTTSADVHKQVREALADASSLYRLDTERLVALQPDVILTQSTCRVCSIDLATVEETVGPASCSAASADDRGEIPAIPGKTTRIVTCNPISLLEAVVTQFEQLGREVGLPDDGQALGAQHLERLRALEALAKARVEALVQRGGVAPRVLLVEWLDPLFVGKMGWMREIIESAGGQVVESLPATPGAELPPIDVVIVALCGLSVDKTEHEIALGNVGDWWRDVLQAQPKVYLVDGTAMFTRPTPRLLLALEWLVHVLHRESAAEAEAWVQASTFPFKQVDVVAALAAFARESSAEKRKQEELAEIEELHRVACQNKQAMYTDPATGYSVMTAYHLSKSQVCCGNGCRHCPYGHVNVSDPARRKNRLTDSVVLQPKRRGRSKLGGELLWPEDRANTHLDEAAPSERDLVVMFWSGGKDSLLALTTLYAAYAADPTTPMPQVVLLTTIDPESHTVPIQCIPDRVIAQQAEALGLPLCLVGVGLGDDYVPQIKRALAELPARVGGSRRRSRASAGATAADTTPAIKALVFGDLHLEDIRAWRVETFGKDYELRFPVWQQDYETVLLPRLHDLIARTGTRIVFSTIQSPELEKHGVRVGDTFDSTNLEALNAYISGSQDATAVDLMGEKGEFHTCVVFPGMASPP